MSIGCRLSCWFNSSVSSSLTFLIKLVINYSARRLIPHRECQSVSQVSLLASLSSLVSRRLPYRHIANQASWWIAADGCTLVFEEAKQRNKAGNLLRYFIKQKNQRKISAQHWLSFLAKGFLTCMHNLMEAFFVFSSCSGNYEINCGESFIFSSSKEQAYWTNCAISVLRDYSKQGMCTLIKMINTTKK